MGAGEEHNEPNADDVWSDSVQKIRRRSRELTRALVAAKNDSAHAKAGAVVLTRCYSFIGVPRKPAAPQCRQLTEATRQP
jgi:hypothetical protein